MNKIQMKDLFETYGEQKVRKYFNWVDPSKLIDFDQKARVKGDLQDKVKRYTQQFLGGTVQEVPLSTVPLPDGFIVKDGVTRGRAKQTAHAIDPTQEVLISTFHHDVLNFSADEWEDFQDKSNDHLGETENSKNDLTGAVQRRIKSARLDSIIKARNGGTPIDYNVDIDRYGRVGGEYFKDELFPNCGHTWKWFSNRIKDTLSKSGKLVASIKTYAGKDLQKEYVAHGGTAYAATRGNFKNLNNNERVFVLRENTRLNPNLYGALVNHIMNAPNAEFTVLISYDRVETKEDADIIADRIEALAAIKKVVSLLGSNACNVRVVSSAQITSDPKGIKVHWTSKTKTIRRPGLKSA
jgi:hypothetical protein